jgi:hypothetical protein
MADKTIRFLGTGPATVEVAYHELKKQADPSQKATYTGVVFGTEITMPEKYANGYLLQKDFGGNLMWEEVV